jgi:hypothetical protein
MLSIICKLRHNYATVQEFKTVSYTDNLNRTNTWVVNYQQNQRNCNNNNNNNNNNGALDMLDQKSIEQGRISVIWVRNAIVFRFANSR